MTSGYVRQASGNIVTGHVIAAADLNAEFNALASAFDSTVGHIHDGTVGGGGLIPSVIYIATTVGGTVNAVAVTSTSPTNFTLSNGELLTFTPVGTNTNAVTLSVNGGPANPLLKASLTGNIPVVLGDVGEGYPLICQYFASGSFWLALNIALAGYEETFGTSQSIGLGQYGYRLVNSSAVTYTIDQSTNLTTLWYISVFAQGGALTITPNAADSINAGTVGASLTIPKGNYAVIFTDGAGNIYITNTNINVNGSLTIAGGFGVTLTATGTTSLTLPTTGTLATLAGVEALTNKTINGLTIASSTGTLTIANGKTHAVSNSLTFTGTDSTSFAFPSSSDTVVTLGTTQALTNKTINGLTITSSTGTLTIANGKTAIINNSLTLAGTDATTITFQGTDTYVGRATTDTLTNKTLTNPVISAIINTGTLTLPTSTDTLVGKATTDTFTNKTFDTAGTGNSFKIAGTAITANTGTGSNVLAVSPTFTGTPLAPTAVLGTNTTQIATTAFVQSAAGGSLQAANNLSDLASLATTLGNLGLVKSGTTNGTITIPTSTGNLIVKWGTGTTTSGTGSVTFGTAFPTAIYTVVIGLNSNSPVGGVAAVNTLTVSGFQLACNTFAGGGLSASIYYIAIGN